MTRHIEPAPPFPRVFNFRDLGGHTTRDGQVVNRHRIYRSDSLNRLDETDRAAFERHGIRTVLDLRRPAEVEEDGRVPDWPGIDYRNLDFEHREWTWTAWPPFDSPAFAEFLAERYLLMADEGAAGIAAAIEVLADADNLPAVVHCWAGRDRTGVVSALVLALAGVDDAGIDAEYQRSTSALDRYKAWARANDENPYLMSQWYRAPAGTMHRFLRGLRDRYGSARAYLTASGADPDRLDALRRLLLDRPRPH